MEIARCKMAIDKLLYLGESEKSQNSLAAINGREMLRLHLINAFRSTKRENTREYFREYLLFHRFCRVYASSENVIRGKYDVYLRIIQLILLLDICFMQNVW